MKSFFKSKRNILILVLTFVIVAETALGGIFLFSGSGSVAPATEKPPATVRGKVMNDLGEMVMSNIIVEEVSTGKRSLYTTNQLSGYSLKLAAGTYNLYYTRGMQYSTVMKTYTVDYYKTYYLEDVRLVRLYDSEAKNFYPGDLHMHTFFSDGADSVLELAYANIAAGLSWGLLSDHNDNTGISEWMQTARIPYDIISGQSKLFTPLAGVEITTGYGHFQSIGSSAVVEQWDIRLDLGENPYDEVSIILDEIRRNGAIVQLNHPYSTGTMGFNNYKDLWNLVTKFDTIEIWNGYFEPCGYVPPEGGYNQNRETMLKWFELLNNGQKIFATSGTDLHSSKGTFNPANYGASKEYEKLLKQTGQYAGMPTFYSYLPNGCSEENILNAVKNGNSFLTNGPLVFADVDGVSYGMTTEAGTGTKTINFESFCRDGLASYNIYKNGEIIKNGSLTGTNVNTEISIDGISAGDWIVIEVFGTGVMYAVTNPIFFN